MKPGRETETCLVLTIANRHSDLLNLLDQVDGFGISSRLANSVIHDVRLVLEELITNVISYGYSDGGEHWIVVKLFLKEEMLTIEIEDDSEYFNPLQHHHKPEMNSAEEKAKGGQGIHLARTLVDEIVYQRVAEKNVLCLKMIVAEN